jgi:DnaK suppressor protein
MEKYRVALLAKQRELTEAYATVKGESREAPGGDGTEDYIDYAVNSYAKEFLLSLTELDRKQLILVEDALRRIDRGEYGRCMQCADPINPKRLEVQPWARHCVRCQELEEQGLLPQYAGYPGGESMDEEEEPAEEEFEEVEPEEDEEVDLEVDTIPLEEDTPGEADDEE